MKSSLVLVIISLVWMLKPSDSYAQYLKCSKSPVHIHYLNGMFNSLGDAEKSKAEIASVFNSPNERKKIAWNSQPTFNFTHNRSYLREAGLDVGDISPENPKAALLALMDGLEAADQKLQNYAEAYGIDGINTWEEIAASYYGLKYASKHPAALLVSEAIATLLKSKMTFKEEDTQAMLAALTPYKDAKDKVIIVSHSQGNLHANEMFVRLFPGFQADYPFQQPLDVENNALIGNLWGNFQVSSPATIITNPRHKTMRFVQDTVFGAGVGQSRNFILELLPDGQATAGQSERAPDNDPNAHTFLLYTSNTYRSALVCPEGPCSGTAKTNREHFIDRMQEIAEMLPSNCGEIEPVVTSALSNTSATQKIIKNYTKVELDFERTKYGSAISSFNSDDPQLKLLLSGFTVGEQVSRKCLNVDDNPYFCDELLDRSIASIDIVSNSLPDLTFENTFGEKKVLSLASVVGDDKVFNGNEDIFDPEVSYAGPYEFEAGIAKKANILATDNEFPSHAPIITGIIGDNLVVIPDKPDHPSEMVKLKVGAIGKFGAHKEIEVDVLAHYCQGQECDLRLWPEFPVVEVVENLSTGYSPDGGHVKLRVYYPSVADNTNSSRFNFPLTTTITIWSMFSSRPISKDSFEAEINVGGTTELKFPLHQPGPGSNLSYRIFVNLPKSNGREWKDVLANGGIYATNCLDGYTWSYKLNKCGKVESAGPSFVCSSSLTSNSNVFASQWGWYCGQVPYHGALVPIAQGLNWNGLSTGYVSSHCTECAFGPNGEPPPRPAIPSPINVSLSGTWYDYVNDVELPWTFTDTVYFSYP